jgi:hypothetical protein
VFTTKDEKLRTEKVRKLLEYKVEMEIDEIVEKKNCGWDLYSAQKCGWKLQGRE